MWGKKALPFGPLGAVLGLTLLLLSLSMATPAHAQTPEVDNGTCVNCHEDLYFLHDTGKWFCLCESPMRCVDCHGGDPMASTQETAHYDRSAHPVVNEDISTCQRCHGQDCHENVSKFDEVAGIKAVKLVSPIPVPTASDLTSSLPTAKEQNSVNWLSLLEILPLIVIVGIALTIFIKRKVRRS